MTELIHDGDTTYEKLHRLGRGSTAVVWLVRSTKDDGLFASKEIVLSESDRQRWFCTLRETAINRVLNHKNIVKIYKIIRTDMRIHIIMEYCPNGTLYDYACSHPLKRLSIPELHRIAQQLLNVCIYMDNHNVIHRDLKIQNILLDKDMKIKVSDLGSARHGAKGVPAQTLAGTPNYMAPEMLSGEPYDSKVDIWAFAVHPLLWQVSVRGGSRIREHQGV